ncbi:hypothetical protein [Flavobacterium sp.]|uniref:hypothetical protein n=1 Tax=Flavobacterium sp. TaxID=239 RepID=UPI002619074F|nr:hypothetical protein [Flavobacterium sp.]
MKLNLKFYWILLLFSVATTAQELKISSPSLKQIGDSIFISFSISNTSDKNYILTKNFTIFNGKKPCIQMKFFLGSNSIHFEKQRLSDTMDANDVNFLEVSINDLIDTSFLNKSSFSEEPLFVGSKAKTEVYLNLKNFLSSEEFKFLCGLLKCENLSLQLELRQGKFWPFLISDSFRSEIISTNAVFFEGELTSGRSAIINSE